MRTITKSLIVSLSLIAAPVLAQDAAPAPAAAPAAVKAGDAIYSSDGWRVGRVTSLLKTKDGTPVTALIIFQGNMVKVPLSTVSAGAKGLTSSLSIKQIRG